MLRFLAHRLFGAVFVLFGVSVVIFMLARVIPGAARARPEASREQVEAMGLQMGFVRPLLEQYGRFIAGAGEFDFGRSLDTDQLVAEDIARGYPATLELVLTTGLVMTIFGILMGVDSAHYKDRWPDSAARIFALLGVSLPNFVWAIVLMLLLAFRWQVLPRRAACRRT